MASVKTVAPVQLSVRGDSATEIFVLDGALNLVHRGLGELHTQLVPGLYKVKFKLGPVVQEQHLFIEPGSQPVQLTAPALSFTCRVNFAA